MRFVLAFLATGLVGALATGVRADVRVVPGTTKVLKGAPPAGLAQIDLEAARNEWVAFQVVITSPASPLGAVSVELTDLAGPGGAVVAASGAELSLEELVEELASTYLRDQHPLVLDAVVDKVLPWWARPIVKGPVLGGIRFVAKQVSKIDPATIDRAGNAIKGRVEACRNYWRSLDAKP